MQKKRIFHILLLALPFALVAWGAYSFGGHTASLVWLKKFWHSEQSSVRQPEGYAEVFERTQAPSLAASHKKLTGEEYSAYKKELTDLVDAQDPTAAIKKLGKDLTAGSIGSDCHNLSHEIGRAAYAKYKDPLKAFAYNKQVCGYGYIHGVIESYVAESADPLQTIETTCQDYADERREGECYHAMGHAVMIYSSNDVPFALEACSQYPDDVDKMSCGLGVFMENFSADADHPSQFIDSSNPLFPCPSQKNIYKPSCYKMAATFYLTLHNSDFSHILDWCGSVESDFQAFCARGAAQQFVQYTAEPKIAEQFCLSGPASLVTPCIQEVVRLFLVYQERSVVEASCQEFVFVPTKAICQKAAWSESQF